MASLPRACQALRETAENHHKSPYSTLFSASCVAGRARSPLSHRPSTPARAFPSRAFYRARRLGAQARRATNLVVLMFSCAAISKPDYKPPAKTADTKSLPLKVTAKLRTAVDAMVWQGLQREDAARSAGLTPNALYAALRKPHVKAHYLSECEILRTSGRARRIHRLEEIAEATSNLNASVQAIRTLDAVDGANSSIGSNGSASMPGVTIHIHAAPSDGSHTQPVRVVEANPLISHDPDILHENVDR